MTRTAPGGVAKSLPLFRQPFDLLAEITASAVQSARDGRHHLTKSETLLKGTPYVVRAAICLREQIFGPEQQVPGPGHSDQAV